MIKEYTKRIIFFLIFFHLLNGFNAWGQGLDKLKALWIVQNFAPNAVWSEEGSIEEFTIGVFGTSTDVYQELVNYSVTRQIRGKNFSVKRFRKLRDITYTHVLYVESNENNNLREVFDKIRYNTLLITDQSGRTEYTMLDLFDLQKARKKFEINKENAAEFGITFDKAILLHGGKEADLKELYANTEKQLKLEKQKLQKQREELARQTGELARLKRDNLRERQENARQKGINDQQKSEIDKQHAEIEEQSQYLARVQENISVQKEQLNHNERILEGQEDKIKSFQDEVRKRRETIEKQLTEIEKDKLEIIEADITKFGKGFETKFDVGVCTLGMSIIPDYYAAYANLISNVKKGGELIIGDMQLASGWLCRLNPFTIFLSKKFGGTFEGHQNSLELYEMMKKELANVKKREFFFKAYYYCIGKIG